jgi:membrane protease YdiL (CAAX protease family)
LNGILEIFLILGLIILANVLDKSPNEANRRSFDIAIRLLNAPFFFSGILLVLVPDQMVTEMQGMGFPLDAQALFAFGIAMQLMAVWGVMFSFPSTRQGLTKYLPAIRSHSPVHTLALILAGYLIISTLAQLALGLFEELAESAVSVSLNTFIVQQLAFALIAVFGVGASVRRSPAQVNERMGLFRPTGHALWEATFWMIGILILQAAAGAIWEVINPEQVALVNSLAEQLYTDFNTPWEWLLLALAAGIGEELLFRGALQPIFGLWPTAVFFAVIHTQYGFFTPATAALIAIGLVLGIVRQRHGTVTAVYVHASYNFILGLATLYGGASGL